jgi:hypothetical protein
MVGEIADASAVIETGRPYCFKIELKGGNQSYFILDLRTAEELKRISSIVLFIMMRNDQRKARENLKKNIVNLSSLQDDVYKKYEIDSGRFVNVTQYHSGYYKFRIYTNPEFQENFDLSNLQVVQQETNPPTTNPQQPSSDTAYVNQKDEKKYVNEPQQDVSENKYANNDENFGQDRQTSAENSSYGNAEFGDSLQAESKPTVMAKDHFAKEEHKPDKKAPRQFTKETWNTSGKPKLETRILLNEVGAKSKTEILLKICHKERSKIEKSFFFLFILFIY